ncbi:MAG: nitroreductase family protein, partial [Candidatus Altiarchaeales archaeon]
IMGLREYLRPVAIIPLGYPAEKPRYIPSRKLEVYEEGIDF